MKVTPLDIQHKIFPRQFRGYHPDQVNRFLDEIAETIESLVRENSGLREKVSVREDEMNNLRKAEATLTNTLISSQNFADQIKLGARQDAERILKEAELKGGEMLLHARTELADLQRGMADLYRQRALALERIRSTLKTFERLLEMEEEGGSPLELTDPKFPQADRPSPSEA